MDLISTVLTAMFTSGVVTAIANWIIRSNEIGEQRRWEIKRESCLKALKIIDSRFADYKWYSNGNPIKVDKDEFFTTAEIRSCFNMLTLACKDSSVPKSFEKCLNLQVDNKDPQKLTMGAVIPFRNAVRKELGFGSKEFKTDVVWITHINRFHPKK